MKNRRVHLMLLAFSVRSNLCSITGTQIGLVSQTLEAIETDRPANNMIMIVAEVGRSNSPTKQHLDYSKEHEMIAAG